MISKTSELGVYITLFLAIREESTLVTPKTLAKAIGGSQSYISKVAGHLVKAGILRSQRGTHGGVTLNHEPADITLLSIIEACQGVILPDYCAHTDLLDKVCSYHVAMHELHQALTGVLRKWTLQNLLKQPCSKDSISDQADCRMGWIRGLSLSGDKSD